MPITNYLETVVEILRSHVKLISSDLKQGTQVQGGQEVDVLPLTDGQGFFHGTMGSGGGGGLTLNLYLDGATSPVSVIAGNQPAQFSDVFKSSVRVTMKNNTTTADSSPQVSVRGIAL